MGHTTGMTQIENLKCARVRDPWIEPVDYLFPAHLPRPGMSLLRQRLKAPGARIPEIHSGFFTYNVVITSKLSDLSVFIPPCPELL